MSLGFFTHPLCLEHDTGRGHPERADRLQAVLTAVRQDPLEKQLEWVEDVPARAPESLHAVHTAQHVNSIRQAVAEGAASLDADTPLSAQSWKAACKAADLAVEAADRVWNGTLDRAFCAVRPPGHHAEPDRAMGFCLFNNIALAASHVLKSGAERIAIVDWDVHHGNGTEAAFRDNPQVLFVSLHQYPWYPGTGGQDVGSVRNLPLPAGFDREAYMATFRTDVLQHIDTFQPEMLFISAGFDAHRADPLAQLNLETEDFAECTRLLVERARRWCKGRVVSTLEGGYNLQALSDSVLAHLREML